MTTTYGKLPYCIWNPAFLVCRPFAFVARFATPFFKPPRDPATHHASRPLCLARSPARERAPDGAPGGPDRGGELGGILGCGLVPGSLHSVHRRSRVVQAR